MNKDQKIGETMETYRWADDKEVIGEFAWVSDFEFFEDDNEGTVVRETWVLAKRATLSLDINWCETCDSEGQVDGITCETCKGEGKLTNEWIEEPSQVNIIASNTATVTELQEWKESHDRE